MLPFIYSCSAEFNAAINTSDHEILLDCLQTWVGISGTSLQWFKSYLKDRRFFVGTADTGSSATGVHCGVSPGVWCWVQSSLIYMLPLGHLIRRYDSSFHVSAGDTQFRTL